MEEVRRGEIVLACRDGRLFLHRLIASGPNGFVLRGDSLPQPDPAYPAEALLGRLADNDGIRQTVLARLASRAAGLLFCHCDIVRRIALKLRSLTETRDREIRSAESLP
jgi:hypothetical protein